METLFKPYAFPSTRKIKYRHDKYFEYIYICAQSQLSYCYYDNSTKKFTHEGPAVFSKSNYGKVMPKPFKSKFRSSFKKTLIWDDLLTETKEKTSFSLFQSDVKPKFTHHGKLTE